MKDPQVLGPVGRVADDVTHGAPGPGPCRETRGLGEEAGAVRGAPGGPQPRLNARGPRTRGLRAGQVATRPARSPRWAQGPRAREAPACGAGLGGKGLRGRPGPEVRGPPRRAGTGRQPRVGRRRAGSTRESSVGVQRLPPAATAPQTPRGRGTESGPVPPSAAGSGLSSRSPSSGRTRASSSTSKAKGPFARAVRGRPFSSLHSLPYGPPPSGAGACKEPSTDPGLDHWPP